MLVGRWVRMDRGLESGTSAIDMPRPGAGVRWWESAAVAVIAVCGLGGFRFALQIPPAVAEAILVVAILAVPLASPALRAVAHRTSTAQRAILAGIIGAMLVGHFHGKAYDTFPFVTWDIYEYTPALGKVRLFDYYAVRRNATEEHLIPADLFPALRKKLAVHLEQIAAAIEASSDAPQDSEHRVNLMRQYDHLLHAMARAYNRRHANDPLIAIRIERWTVPVDAYAGRESIARQPFRMWQLAGESE